MAVCVPGTWAVHRAAAVPESACNAGIAPVSVSASASASGSAGCCALRKSSGRCSKSTLFGSVKAFPVPFSRHRVTCSGTATSAPPNAPASPSPAYREESDVQLVKLTNDTWSLRGRSLERLKFEIEYGLKRGTTDNSYIIKGGNATALVDVPDRAFSKAFVQALASSVELGSIKYLVLGHLSPKRAESLISLGEALPDGAPRIQVYCSNPAAQLVKASIPEKLLEKAFAVKVVRGDEKLDLGGGHELQFVLTPTPRWPDGLCTYDPATQLLFTHKLFSAHVCGPSEYDTGGWEAYGEDWRFFYDCMLAPVPKQAKTCLEKLPVVAQFSKPNYSGKTGIDIVKADVRYILSTVLSALKLPGGKSAVFYEKLGPDGALVAAALCPLHGPIVRSALTELVREYRTWTEEKVKQAEEATVAVIYASAYGNTAALAQAISRGISKAGVGIETVNCEEISSEEVLAVVKRSRGFVVGSPTLGGHIPTPVQNALGVILNDTDSRSKPCGVFGSFGWSGEAVDEIEQRLKNGGFSFAFPAIRCKFKPTEATLQVCEESGTDLAQAVKKRKVKERSKAGSQFTVASNVEQAVGRIVGSLCVLSAKSGDAESAMLASWVSQASFVPPGLTIAVAKERAVEGLVLPGGKFVLNVLGQGDTTGIMKQLLKKFNPGEPRFEGLETKIASNGGVILVDSIAWMECTVTSRMETGDHWVLYATVDGGELLDDKRVTAIHHRKTGSRY